MEVEPTQTQSAVWSQEPGTQDAALVEDALSRLETLVRDVIEGAEDVSVLTTKAIMRAVEQAANLPPKSLAAHKARIEELGMRFVDQRQRRDDGAAAEDAEDPDTSMEIDAVPEGDDEGDDDRDDDDDDDEEEESAEDDGGDDSDWSPEAERARKEKKEEKRAASFGGGSRPAGEELLARLCWGEVDTRAVRQRLGIADAFSFEARKDRDMRHVAKLLVDAASAAEEADREAASKQFGAAACLVATKMKLPGPHRGAAWRTAARCLFDLESAEISRRAAYYATRGGTRFGVQLLSPDSAVAGHVADLFDSLGAAPGLSLTQVHQLVLPHDDARSGPFRRLAQRRLLWLRAPSTAVMGVVSGGLERYQRRGLEFVDSLDGAIAGLGAGGRWAFLLACEVALGSSCLSEESPTERPAPPFHSVEVVGRSPLNAAAVTDEFGAAMAGPLDERLAGTDGDYTTFVVFDAGQVTPRYLVTAERAVYEPEPPAAVVPPTNHEGGEH